MELSFLHEAVPMLDQYLESKDVAWQLPGLAREPGFSFGMLTIGVVLFMLKRVKARGLSGEMAVECGDYETHIFQAKIHNERSWLKKVGQDLGNRARLWGAFLEEYRGDPLAAINTYPNQVVHRSILQLLWEEQDPGSLLVAPFQFMLQTLDTGLKSIFEPGDFIWEPDIKPGFPEKIYWYLYGSLKRK
jgi:hypothetical protein